MDIGLIHPTLEVPRGGERQLCELAYYLDKMGNEVTIYVFDGNNDDFSLNYLLKNINVVSLGKPWHIGYKNILTSSINVPRWYKMIRNLSSKLSNHDVLNLHNTPANWMSNFTDIPSFWTYNEPAYVNSVSDPKFTKILKPYRILDNYLTKSELIGVLDNRMKEIVGNLFDNKIEVIGSGAGLLRPINHIENDFIDIIVVGPVSRQRRVFDIVKACSIINNDKFKVHFVGKTDDLELYNEMCSFIDSKCNFKVIFHGFVSDDELYHIWNLADLAIMASKVQPWGIFPLEAILGGIPTITSNQIGSNEFIDNDEFIFETTNIEDLASKIEEIIDNYEFYKNKTLKLSEFVEKNYSWQGYSNRIYKILKNVSKK